MMVGSSNVAINFAISKKCIYALRGLFELASRNTDEPVKIRELADAQGIPSRFLEVIFSELRRAGFVDSRRGADGGYVLATAPKGVTVGAILRYVQGSKPDPDPYFGGPKGHRGDFAFGRFWQRLNAAVADVADGTTLADLVKYDRRSDKAYVPDYVI